jgi:hypothetical protein
MVVKTTANLTKLKSGRTYTVECGIDLAGDDLKSQVLTTFVSCAERMWRY